jgi:hypothetical protein
MDKYIFQIGSNNLDESNDSLMKLWGTFLSKGKIGWHYRPFKWKSIIDVGDVSIHGFSTYNVKINLKTKKTINSIEFIRQSHEAFTDKEKDYFQIIDSERKNIKKSNYIFDFIINIESTKGVRYLYPFKYKDFVIFCIDEEQFIEFSVEGYCKDQASEMAFIKITHICDLLSIQTNSIFTLKKSYIAKSETNLSEDVEEKSQNDEEWIDEYPIENSHFILPDYAKKYIYENIIKKAEYSTPIIKASRHFLNGLLLTLDNRNEYCELFTSEMMSCLEVLTEYKEHDPVTCPSCGQPKYSIRQRVLSLIADELSYHTYMKKKFDEYYVTRSKYLHSGELAARRSYHGVSLPQISDKSLSGCETYPFLEDINLIERVSYIGRKVMRK